MVWFVFFQKDSGLRPPDPPLNMRLAMVLFSILCIGLGIWPEPLYGLLPYPVEYAPYSVPHVVNMLQLLLFSGLAFFIMLPLMERTLTISLDFDWFYRTVGKRVFGGAATLTSDVLRGIETAVRYGVGALIAFTFRQAGPQGVLARTGAVGSMVTWVVVLLGVYLLLYFV